VHQELRALGISCGKHWVAQRMRDDGLQSKSARRFRVTTSSAHAAPIAPNVLDRQFSVVTNPTLEAPDRVWAADITYIPTAEGWLYLAVVLDLASRRVVGWALRTRLAQELALVALRMALEHRGARGCLHHSDRGVQYASAACQQLQAGAGLEVSVSRVGDCWDNAVVESFFATPTKALLVDGLFPTRATASRAVRVHRDLVQSTAAALDPGYRTPAEYEEQLLRVN
jgi:putative transposase